MRRDQLGIWFDVARAKTGRRALATLSKRAETLLAMPTLPQLPLSPSGRLQSSGTDPGAPYSKDTLGDDFRDVRSRSSARDEKRQLADFRRSGSSEALEGDAPPEKLSGKMANSLSTSNRLHKTYAPVRLASVRDVDEREAPRED